MIPKIIHQIWLGPLPPPQRWLDSWRDHHPDWDYHLWTNEKYQFCSPISWIPQDFLND